MKRWTHLAAGAAVLAALILVALGEPDAAAKIEQQRASLQARLDAREIHVDPWELYEGRWNSRMKVLLVDVRSEADYNVFHLRGARRVPLERLQANLPTQGVAVVLMSNDEAAAEAGWMRLTALGQPNAYVLSGGVNLWLDIFRPAEALAQVATGHRAAGGHLHGNLDARSTTTADVLRHRFRTARGDAWPFAFPPQPHEGSPHREYKKVIQIMGAAAKTGGGCG
ncbi:MAG: rhodanese-like domain-containing protein [Myxococcales bacterium]|nr:rhodanese-like domain-containing protein [Myxococcales bacterium]